MGLKKSVPGLQFCVACLHRKLREPISFIIPHLMTSEGCLGFSLMTLTIRIQIARFCSFFLRRILHLASCIRHTRSGSTTLMCNGHYLNWYLRSLEKNNPGNKRCCQDTFCFLMRHLIIVLLHHRHYNDDVADDCKSTQVPEEPLSYSFPLKTFSQNQ